MEKATTNAALGCRNANHGPIASAARRPTPLGLFSKLPRELKDPIHSSLFSAGYTALTRISSAIHADTKGALSRHGVYRLGIEVYVYDHDESQEGRRCHGSSTR